MAALDRAPGRSLSALKRLYGDGLLDTNVLKTSAYLTPEGYPLQTTPFAIQK